MKQLPDNIRHCCGVRPVVVKTFYPNTHYAMVRIVCPMCNNGTGDKRRISDAINEWEHPEKVHLN